MNAGLVRANFFGPTSDLQKLSMRFFLTIIKILNGYTDFHARTRIQVEKRHSVLSNWHSQRLELLFPAQWSHLE